VGHSHSHINPGIDIGKVGVRATILCPVENERPPVRSAEPMD